MEAKRRDNSLRKTMHYYRLDTFRAFFACLVMIVVVTTSTTSWAANGEVNGVRVWNGPDGTRLVFDLNTHLKHALFTLPNPERVVIDFKNASLATSLRSLDLTGTPVKRIRTGSRRTGGLRVVLDLKERVSPKSAILKPNREYGYRLLVDLDKPRSASRVVAKSRITPPKRDRDVVIAIDAGHGGEDPGARGRAGTKEKHVVLAIARRLAKLINSEGGMKAVLIRDGDYYLGLRKRMNKARTHGTDLFVSIHADAFKDPRVRGLSIYTLSSNGASSEAARWLADKENSSDLVGGVSLEDKDDVLASVLLDLAQTATSDASQNAAAQVLKRLKKIGKVHKSSVQHASFVVLKSPDIPSILVETAFISNPAEEKKLRSSRYQQALARAIFSGIYAYFDRQPPPGTYMASRRRHVISRGDTLGKIAKQYQVSIKSLRAINNISGDRIMPGQVLQIPIGKDS